MGEEAPGLRLSAPAAQELGRRNREPKPGLLLRKASQYSDLFVEPALVVMPLAYSERRYSGQAGSVTSHPWCYVRFSRKAASLYMCEIMCALSITFDIGLDTAVAMG